MPSTERILASTADLARDFPRYSEAARSGPVIVTAVP